MGIKALKIVLTVTLGIAIFAVVGALPSLQTAVQFSLLPLLYFGIACIFGGRFDRPLSTTGGFVLAVISAFVCRATWPGIDVFWNLPFQEAVMSIIPSELAFAFFVAGIVLLGMNLSDLIDRRCSVKLIDDRPT